MDERPTLTIVSNFYIGGVFNFHRNILSHDAIGALDKKVIFLYQKEDGPPTMNKGFGLCPEFICEVDAESKTPSREIADVIGNEKGVVVTNFEPELAALHFYPRSNKTIVFVCHDEAYIRNALKYEFLIDAYVAHNPFFYELLLKQLPHRREDIYYIPYGVEIEELQKSLNLEGPLNLVWLARLAVSKGIYELPVIDDLLKEKQIIVNWTIIGYGPESDKFRSLVKERSNFSFDSPSDSKAVMKLLDQQDIFVLPSRLDGLPVAMLESMSRGVVPVMYKFNDGITKIVTGEIGFIVEVGDNVALADCISQLFHDRVLLGRMSELARKKVMDDYDIKKQAKKYFELYENIQPSPRKGKWKSIPSVHGSEFHPFIPGSMVRMYRKLRKRFS